MDTKIVKKYFLALEDITDNISGNKVIIWQKGKAYKVYYECEDSYIVETENGSDKKYGIGRELEGSMYKIITDYSL